MWVENRCFVQCTEIFLYIMTQILESVGASKECSIRLAVEPFLSPNDLPNSLVLRRTVEVWRNLQANGGRMLSDARRGFRRIALIIRTLRAVVLHHDERAEAENYLKCLKVYFATLPDPEVSADEVREFLQYMTLGQDCSQGVDRFVCKWMELFGGGGQYAPRSLAHQCRRTVRSVLVQNMSGVVLPALVDRLPLPRRLKDFVLATPVSRL